jgi:hypothetical protein
LLHTRPQQKAQTSNGHPPAHSRESTEGIYSETQLRRDNVGSETSNRGIPSTDDGVTDPEGGAAAADDDTTFIEEVEGARRTCQASIDMPIDPAER